MDDLQKRIDELSPARRALLELRLKQRSEGTSPSGAIRPRANRTSTAVSFAQQRLWFLDQLDPNQSTYNVPRALHLLGKLDVAALERTLRELTARHEPFRTHFAMIDGTLRQIIDPEAQISLPLIDLSDLSPAQRENTAAQLQREEAARPFDLKYGPVIRAALLRLDPEEHILLLTTHHIVSDAWSAAILRQELVDLYDAFARGQESTLPGLPIQYADFAEWQRDWLQGEALTKQLSYWKSQFEDAPPVLNLPADYARSTRTFRGADCSSQLSPQLSDEVTEFSRSEGVTVFMTLLATFYVLLWRYTQQDDIVIGSPIAGRNR